MKNTYLEVLKKAFSTNGLLAYKIESLVKDLEELANKYLAELSDGRFNLQFVINNDKLNVEVDDNGKAVEILALSSGELARVNIATLIAIFVSGAWIPGLVIALVGGIVVGIQTLLGKKLGLFAKGGTVNTPLQIVGEEGPELVTLPQGSRIRTASQTRKALSTNSQTVNNFNITINAKDTSRAEMRRIADEIGRMVNSKVNRSTSSRTLG